MICQNGRLDSSSLEEGFVEGRGVVLPIVLGGEWGIVGSADGRIACLVVNLGWDELLQVFDELVKG